ncbi:hypothetical protein ACFSQJ_19305 [Croceitalea marina]|uniref:Uncharacterized protein n=1 Tax=Croceitalea marina TaxID=1775166 RepID=A0ABW5N2T3_9FLAO
MKSAIENQLQTKEILFLDFWLGMSIEDFKNVRGQLINEGLIIISNNIMVENRLMPDGLAFGFVTGKCGSIPSIPNFKNDRLESIELIGNTCFYSLYMEKYNLPTLSKRHWFSYSSKNNSLVNRLGKKGVNSKDLIEKLKTRNEDVSSNKKSEMILPQDSPLELDAGEVVFKGRIAIQIEHEAYKTYKEEYIPRPIEFRQNPTFNIEDLYNYDEVFFEGKSMGAIIFKYQSKINLQNEIKEFQKLIDLDVENQKRREMSNSKAIDKI